MDGLTLATWVIAAGTMLTAIATIVLAWGSFANKKKSFFLRWGKVERIFTDIMLDTPHKQP